MVKTKVINHAECDVTLKMSSGGIQTMLHSPLKPNEEYTIHSDTNATYREYWCAAQEGAANVFLTSDDCAQFSEVTLMRCQTTDANFVMTWKGTKPRNPKPFCSIM
jgi:hypothetical protein